MNLRLTIVTLFVAFLFSFLVTAVSALTLFSVRYAYSSLSHLVSFLRDHMLSPQDKLDDFIGKEVALQGKVQDLNLKKGEIIVTVSDAEKTHDVHMILPPREIVKLRVGDPVVLIGILSRRGDRYLVSEPTKGEKLPSVVKGELDSILRKYGANVGKLKNLLFVSYSSLIISLLISLFLIFWVKKFLGTVRRYSKETRLELEKALAIIRAHRLSELPKNLYN